MLRSNIQSGAQLYVYMDMCMCVWIYVHTYMCMDIWICVYMDICIDKVHQDKLGVVVW